MSESEAGRERAGLEADDFRFSPRPNRAHEIRWSPWSEEAFERAEREGKPVLLSISAVWCHWCHVMDETSYSDDAVIELINERYVPIRVDSDRNPDLNRRYNQGGWPTTAFLSPDGNVLAGATYIPPETMGSALERISALYEQQRDNLDLTIQEALMPEGGRGEPGLDAVTGMGELILAAWDRTYGGLGDAPKFPQPEALNLALELHADEGRGEYLDFAVSSLESMIRGNLLDKVEGGFFRYSTTRDWSIPHYEKMLADNTGLLSALLKAWGVTGKEVFRRTAAETAAYMRRTLSDGASRFYGSQDADEGYYLLDAEGRKGLAPPPIDHTVYTDLAARAAAAFLDAGAALGRAELTEQALESLEFLWEECFRAGDGMAHYHHGTPRRWGLLDDGVAAAAAFLRAFGLTARPEYLERARALLRLAVEDHWDEGRSVLLDTAARHALPGLRPEPADINGQAQAAAAMLHLWAYGGGEEWRKRAGRLLAAISEQWASHGVLAAPYAAAVNLYLRGPLLAKVGGDPGGAARPFLAAAVLSPRSRVLPMVSGEAGRIEGGAHAEVCSMEACHLRTDETGVLAEHLGVHGGAVKEG